jgi:hypothetical protein
MNRNRRRDRVRRDGILLQVNPIIAAASVVVLSVVILLFATVARRTGGKNGMLIRLFTGTGDVLVRRVASSTVEWPADELPFEFGRRLLA